MSDAKWSDWIKWNGGKCPLPEGSPNEVRFRSGYTDKDDSPESWCWQNTGNPEDIIAYRYQISQPEVTAEEEEEWHRMYKEQSKSDGSTASYYELPEGCTELQDLISYRNMNAQDGEMFRAIYRKGLARHSDALRDARKVKFYADAEVKRLEKYCIG